MERRIRGEFHAKVYLRTYEVKFTVKKPAEIKKIRSELSSHTMDLHRDFLFDVGRDFVIF